MSRECIVDYICFKVCRNQFDNPLASTGGGPVLQKGIIKGCKGKGKKTRLEDWFTAKDDERQSKGADVSKVSLLD